MVDVVEVESVFCSDDRSVSGSPGADGAPRSRFSRLLLPLPLVVEESLLAAVLLVLVGCDAVGASRRDCFSAK